MIDYQKAGGLSEEVAAERLLSEGDNSLSAKEHKGIFLVIGGVLSEPMFFLLVACSGIYFTLGDLGESIALMVSVLLVVAITVYQENKTEKALGALKDLSSPRALVIRDGVAKRVAGTEVVRGDVIILNEGDRVPADAILFFTNNLLLDESILTGESVSVRKSGVEAQEEIDRPGTDNSASVYASTLVVGGYGMARIVATGNKTEVGKIGASLADVIPEKTRLQSEIDQLIKVFAWYGLALCLAVAIIFGLKNNDWVSGILSGLSLAMSILPEEFPVILTVFMALGAWRLSRKNVLTSRQKVVQALGGITVLCTDKTGTLTMNQMELEAVNDGKKMIATDGSSNEEIENIVELGYLASQPKPFDPLEKALHKTYHDIASNEKPALFKSWRLLEEYPLSHELLVISHVWERPLKDDYLVAAKGAPEAIVEICHLNASQASMWMKQVEEMARKGLRVLAVARAHYKKDKLPENQHDFEFEIVGLLGFADPIRSQVPQAVADCHRAGVRVVMITGDHSETAASIAKQIGLPSHGKIITGQELSRMSEAELKSIIGNVNVFARIDPTQKLAIVNALKANGEIVGMTGDGVNDAPALKSANVGIAMGQRGTDVAREAAGLVLLDDDFASIVSGIKLGRRIYDNIRKAILYVLAIHIPIAGITVLSVVFGWPLVLLPLHLAFLELIIDPACSIAFENEPSEEDVMSRPPRHPDAKTITWRLVKLAVFQGVSILFFLIVVLKLAVVMGLDTDQVRTMVFTALIFANLGLILANRSWTRSVLDSLSVSNQAVWWVLGMSVFALAGILLFPPARHLFHFSLPTWFDLALAAVLGGSSVMWFEFLERRRAPMN